jgi:hypothetical protein
MRIIGFGDSFIQPLGKDIINENHYLNLVSSIYGPNSHSAYGVPGSSIWNTFFDFKQKYQMHLDLGVDIGVIIFVWTNSSRIYHPAVKDISAGNPKIYEETNDPIWVASRHYFDQLYNLEKINYEMISFFYWFDNWLLQNIPPKTKIIHMWGFPFETDNLDINGNEITDWYKFHKESPNKIKYNVNFKSGVEIRPPLLYFSLNDGWPKNNNLFKEDRFQHLTDKMHKTVADLIIKAIDNYEIGSIISPFKKLI